MVQIMGPTGPGRRKTQESERETEKNKNKENDLAKRKVAATQAKLKQNSSKIQAKLKQNLSKTQAKPKQNSSKVRLRGKDEALPPNFVCACAAIRAGPHRRRAVRSAGLHHVPAQLPAVTRTACHGTNVHFHVNQSPVRLSMQAPLDHLSNYHAEENLNLQCPTPVF